MKFTQWIKWTERNTIENLQYPWVYVIAYADIDIVNNDFDWIEEIIYVGMTNSQGGLKNRLQQFENTIIGKTGHGGAQRVIFKYRNYNELIKKLYVSARYFKCNVTSNQVDDLLVMGKVAEYEYICFAEYVKRYNRLPEFNDKKLSPKK